MKVPICSEIPSLANIFYLNIMIILYLDSADIKVIIMVKMKKKKPCLICIRGYFGHFKKQVG